MLIVQILILIYVIWMGKRKSWTKYVLLGNFIIWYMYLQIVIQNPGTMGIILTEFIIIVLTDLYFLLFSIKQKKNKVLTKENAVLQEHIKMYEQQILQINMQNEQIYGIKHDLKNQFFHINTLIENKEYDKVKEILNKTLGDLSVQKYVQTGNVTFDNLINYKISCAKEQGISVESEILIPVDEIYNSSSIILILGNLMDNAIEACLKVPVKDRFITMRVIKKDSRTFIVVKNSFDGKCVVDKKGNFLTTKENAEMHGFGLKNVKRALEDGGDFSYQIENNIFSVTVIIY